MLSPLLSSRVHASETLGRDARRLRRVARTPSIATLDDLELLLRAHGVPEQRIWAALDGLVTIELSAPLAWAFVMEHDGTALADMLMLSVRDGVGSAGV